MLYRSKIIIRESLIYLVLATIFIAGIITVKCKYSVFDGSKKSKFALRQEMYVFNEQLVKDAKLSRSFTEMMTLASEHEEERLHYAIKRYFDAKSIFPYRIEPRLALAKSYITLSKEVPGYRKLAEKEISFWFQYSHTHT